MTDASPTEQAIPSQEQGKNSLKNYLKAFSNSLELSKTIGVNPSKDKPIAHGADSWVFQSRKKQRVIKIFKELPLTKLQEYTALTNVAAKEYREKPVEISFETKDGSQKQCLIELTPIEKSDLTLMKNKVHAYSQSEFIPGVNLDDIKGGDFSRDQSINPNLKEITALIEGFGNKTLDVALDKLSQQINMLLHTEGVIIEPINIIPVFRDGKIVLKITDIAPEINQIKQ